MIDLNLSDFVAPSVMDTLEVRCMSPLLRFLQLLCENHNRDLQVRNVAVVWRYVNVAPKLWYQ